VNILPVWMRGIHANYQFRKDAAADFKAHPSRLVKLAHRGAPPAVLRRSPARRGWQASLQALAAALNPGPAGGVLHFVSALRVRAGAWRACPVASPPTASGWLIGGDLS